MNQLPQVSVVVSFVKKQRPGADHHLFTLGISRFEQVSMSNQHETRGFRASQHDTRAAKYFGLEYISISVRKTSKSSVHARFNILQVNVKRRM